MTRWLVPSVVLLTGIGAWVAPGALAGSADSPDMTDAEGDVKYHPAFEDSKQSPYLDVLAAWVMYNDASDEFGFWFKLADTTPLESPPDQWSIACQFEADTAGELAPPGTIELRMNVQGNGSATSTGYWQGKSGIPQELSHRLESKPAKPGIGVFWVPHGTVRTYGEDLSSVSVYCNEIFTPADYSIGNIQNSDSGESRETVQLRTLTTNRTRLDNDDDMPSKATDTEASGASEPSQAGTPFVPLIGTVLALAAGATTVRGRRR